MSERFQNLGVGDYVDEILVDLEIGFCLKDRGQGSKAEVETERVFSATH